jgi:hypothetical protein
MKYTIPGSDAIVLRGKQQIKSTKITEERNKHCLLKKEKKILDFFLLFSLYSVQISMLVLYVITFRRKKLPPFQA